MQYERKRAIKGLIAKGRLISQEFSQVAIPTCASSIAYFTFLSMIPLLAIAISLLTAVGISEQEVTTLFLSLVPKELDALVSSLIADAFAQSEVAFSLSSITLLWFVSKVARALRVGLNAAYGQSETRNGFTVIIISIASGLILEVLITVTIYLMFRGRLLEILSFLAPRLAEKDAFMDLLNTLLTIALSAVALALCYSYLPSGRRRPITQLPGAIAAVLACGVLAFGFRLYVDHFNGSTAIYGGLATVALFLLWIYFISNILILGGFLNRILNERLLADGNGSDHVRPARKGPRAPLSRLHLR